MGLLDKLKDLFIDEVDGEEELDLEEENKKIYEEPEGILPKVMRDTIEKEEEKVKFEELKPTREENRKKEDVVSSMPEKRFSFPIDFEEEVTPSRVQNKNVLRVEKEREVPKKAPELYPKKEVVEKPKFKPTPVISPVYGILDKNYRKEEVREKSEENVEMKRPSKKVDFETVRKKAFGNLAEEIKDNLMCENCELYKEVKRINSISSDDLLYDMLVDEPVKSDETVTIEKAYDNYEDFGVAYEPKKEEPKIENNTTIINNNTDVVIAEKIEIEDKKEVEVSREVINDEVEKIPSRQETKKENKDSKVDEDFFELIDSMYKERIDG